MPVKYVKLQNFIPTYENLVNKGIIIAGQTGSGKTTLLRRLLMEFNGKTDAVYLFSETADMTKDFGNTIHSSCIFDTFDEDDLTRIIDRQEKIRSRLYDVGRADLWEDNFHIIIILDDFSTESATWRNSKIVQKLISQGRHYNITFIVSVQYLMTCPPVLRKNARLIFATTMNKKNDRDIFHREMWDTTIGDKHVCDQYINAAIRKKMDFIVVTTEVTRSFDDIPIFRYKVKPGPTPGFESAKLYSSAFLSRMNQVYDSNWKYRERKRTGSTSKKSKKKTIEIITDDSDSDDESR